jgi:hypothetical protein
VELEEEVAMHRSETTEFVSCSDCGADVSSGLDREFEFGESQVLCFDCALRRGGSYDESRDRWSVVPTIDDIKPSYE